MRTLLLTLGVALILAAGHVLTTEGQQAEVFQHRPVPNYGAEPPSAAFSADPFIPMRQPQEDWAALSAGYPGYFQVRIPYRPVFHSQFRPRFRRTQRLEATPLPISPEDAFVEEQLTNTDSPRL